MSGVMASVVGSRLLEINCLTTGSGCMNASSAREVFFNVRSRAKVDGWTCPERVSHPDPNRWYECFDKYCLFDTIKDPCEFRNVAKQNPQILDATIDMLKQFKREMMSPDVPKKDPDADPRRFDGYWEPWLEPSVKVQIAFP